ncbi:hypothetical protein KY290_008050 [Solanum tuberosum]|uniref:Uncharacterized protein n=1 Tax=Solanum tuberosum TaxID=4113 RepID=A0ABQ7W991_SOLTU|nr:hypothetical protein KY290_008050 [Solanum tuberosum]
MFDFDVKGGNYGNPPNLATIFFETRKKDNKLVEHEAIEKHVGLAQLDEMPCIWIWGGVKARDLKGGTSSKAELLSALRSTQEDNKYLNEENKSWNNRISTLEDEIKEIRKMQELFASQQSHVPPMTSHARPPRTPPRVHEEDPREGPKAVKNSMEP